MKVIYDWNLSNYFWNVKMYMYIKLNNQRYRYNWGSNICTDHSIKYFCNYDFFPSFMWILSIFLIFLYMLTYIYSYDIMLEQMWNKHAYLMSHLLPPPNISPDYNPDINLSYPPFPECILCAVVRMLISRLCYAIYS